jgi:hypothetical protein
LETNYEFEKKRKKSTILSSLTTVVTKLSFEDMMLEINNCMKTTNG